MSFNKKMYTIEQLRNIFTEGGINEIHSAFNCADAYIFVDKESSSVYDLLITRNKPKQAIKILKNESTKS